MRLTRRQRAEDRDPDTRPYRCTNRSVNPVNDRVRTLAGRRKVQPTGRQKLAQTRPEEPLPFLKTAADFT